MDKRYVIGVDLGTTNIVVSYADCSSDNDEQTIFPIPQLVGPGQLRSLPMLPAIRYHYTSELSKEQVLLPWHQDEYNASLPKAIIGGFAAELGAKNPNRLVTSAKSWLSYRAESNSEIQLPEKADDEIQTLTPMECTASYLNYIRSAWDHEFPDAPFAKQTVVITVPASFDDIARALTIEAIHRAGIQEFKLLEEPQAACYHWLACHAFENNDLEAQPLTSLEKTKHLMVCDIGGGTTDFTLIKVTPKKDALPELERIGVGDHLMLGGDNMDLSLAARVLQKLEQPITSRNLNKLLTPCQQAKERLLAENGPDELPIQFQSAGTSLFQNTKETRLTRKETQQALLDGFFPEVAKDSRPKSRKKALAELSLPYPPDAGISRHIASFIADHQVALSADEAGFTVPDTWLLNGGPFLSAQIETRLRSIVESWSTNDVVWLQNAEPQTAVAKGAVSYGLAVERRTNLIKSAVVRHYFLKVASDSGNKAVCILPMFSEVDVPSTLEQTFALTKGQPVSFDIGYTMSEKTYSVGDISDWHEKIHQLPALKTEISGQGITQVKLTSVLDELGVLNVTMQDVTEGTVWQLPFNLRQPAQSSVNEDVITPELQRAFETIDKWYGSAGEKAPKEPLRKSLEKILGPRDNWGSSTARQLFDKFLSVAKRRRRSPQHERTWFNLAGFCLRPGMGYEGDTLRIEQIWPLYAQGLQHVQQLDVWNQWWTFWRRASAGLSSEQQLVLYTDCQIVLNAQKRKQGGKPKVAAAPEEKVKVLGALERLPINIKEKMLRSVFNQLFDNKLSADMTWTAARLINRTPLYGSQSHQLADDVIEPYLEKIALMSSKQQQSVQMLIDASIPGSLNNDLWGDVLPSGLSL